MKRWTIIVSWLIWLIVAGCSQPLIQTDDEAIPSQVTTPDVAIAEADSSDDEVKKFTVRATKYHFDHQEIRVNQGDPVEITLVNEKGYHTMKIEGYQLEVKPNRPLTFVATEKGEFIFRCGIICGSGHDEMTGKLVVE